MNTVFQAWPKYYVCTALLNSCFEAYFTCYDITHSSLTDIRWRYNVLWGRFNSKPFNTDSI